MILFYSFIHSDKQREHQALRQFIRLTFCFIISDSSKKRRRSTSLVLRTARVLQWRQPLFSFTKGKTCMSGDCMSPARNQMDIVSCANTKQSSMRVSTSLGSLFVSSLGMNLNDCNYTLRVQHLFLSGNLPCHSTWGSTRSDPVRSMPCRLQVCFFLETSLRRSFLPKYQPEDRTRRSARRVVLSEKDDTTTKTPFTTRGYISKRIFKVSLLLLLSDHR